MKRTCFIFIVLILLTACGTKSKYDDAAATLKSDYSIKWQVRDSELGFAVYKDDKMRELGEKINKTFEKLVENDEIVSVYKHKRANLMKSGKVLETFEKNGIKIYQKATALIWGIEPESWIYVSKDQKEQAEKLINELK